MPEKGGKPLAGANSVASKHFFDGVDAPRTKLAGDRCTSFIGHMSLRRPLLGITTAPSGYCGEQWAGPANRPDHQVRTSVDGLHITLGHYLRCSFFSQYREYKHQAVKSAPPKIPMLMDRIIPACRVISHLRSALSRHDVQNKRHVNNHLLGEPYPTLAAS